MTTGDTSYNHGNGFGNTNDWVVGATWCGGTDFGLNYDGLIDDLRIYHKVLSPSEVSDIYDELA